MTSLKTHLQNTLGNASFAASEELLMRPIAAFADIAASGLTGERTVQFTSPKAIFNGLKALVKTPAYQAELQNFAGDFKTSGAERIWNIIRNGDSQANMEKHQYQEMSSGFPILDLYVKVNFRALTAEDAFFKSYAFRRSLAEQSRMLAVTDRRSDKSINVKNRYQEYIEKPTPEMQMKAIADAEYATFQNDNVISDIVRGGKEKLDENGLELARGSGIDNAV